MAKDKMKKKGNKGTKRLGNASTSAGARPVPGNKRGNRNKRGKRAVTTADARSSVKRQPSRGRTGRLRQGNPSPLIRRQLGAGIRDARQIINSHQGVKSRRPAGRSQMLANSGVAHGIPHIASSAFNDAVRAAIAPIVAPLLRGVGSGSTARMSSATYTPPSQTSNNNGPCCLRVANLAQSVTINDLADLFNGYPGFVAAEMDSPGIAVVSFERRDSATSALDEYNNRELDGRTMMIQVDTANTTNTSSRLGPKPSHAVANQAARTASGSLMGPSRQVRATQRWNEIRSTCDM